MTPATNFPFRRVDPLLPPPEYSAMRRDSPIRRIVLSSGRTAWLISRYDDIRSVLSSPYVSSDMANPGYPLQFDIPSDVIERMKPAILSEDGSAHAERRRIVLPDFTARRVEQLRVRVEKIVDEHISRLLTMPQPLDWIEEFAVPIPSLVICEIFGVPIGDRPFFQEHARCLVSLESDPIARQQSLGSLEVYLTGILKAKSEVPGDDLLSRMASMVDTTQDGSYQQMASLANVMLVGGHETTANMIGLGVLGLIQNPSELAKLRAEPSNIRRAVDELLRFFSIADQVSARVATADIEVSGVRIPEGDGIITLAASGNHDESVFENPGQIRVDRPRRPHLAFGHGPHQCIGQHLAKLELEVALARTFDRFPDIQVACPISELRFKDSAGVYGLERLPVFLGKA